MPILIEILNYAVIINVVFLIEVILEYIFFHYFVSFYCVARCQDACKQDNFLLYHSLTKGYIIWQKVKCFTKLAQYIRN